MGFGKTLVIAFFVLEYGGNSCAHLCEWSKLDQTMISNALWKLH